MVERTYNVKLFTKLTWKSKFFLKKRDSNNFSEKSESHRERERERMRNEDKSSPLDIFAFNQVPNVYQLKTHTKGSDRRKRQRNREKKEK